MHYEIDKKRYYQIKKNHQFEVVEEFRLLSKHNNKDLVIYFKPGVRIIATFMPDKMVQLKVYEKSFKLKDDILHKYLRNGYIKRIQPGSAL